MVNEVRARCGLSSAVEEHALPDVFVIKGCRENDSKLAHLSQLAQSWFATAKHPLPGYLVRGPTNWNSTLKRLLPRVQRAERVDLKCRHIRVRGSRMDGSNYSHVGELHHSRASCAALQPWNSIRIRNTDQRSILLAPNLQVNRCSCTASWNPMAAVRCPLFHGFVDLANCNC